MKRCVLTFALIILSLVSSAQSKRSEVREKISIVSEIIENTSLVIKTSNFNNDKTLIEAGIIPMIIGTYMFEKAGSNEPLTTVEEIYYHKDRSLVSKYSNEQNPKRSDYQPFWLSQVATHIYGDVLKNKNGLYFTKQVWFNLE
tara:strand:+ start:1748 stop:2176 length:429 start_codon:yes stop_codon:yes gene_type:complete